MSEIQTLCVLGGIFLFSLFLIMYTFTINRIKDLFFIYGLLGLICVFSGLCFTIYLFNF